MARDVPLTNIYNMSTNNSTPNKYLTNTVGEFNNRKENHWGLTFPPLQKCVIKIQTREWWQKMRESEENKSCIICDKIFIETEIFDKYYCISIFISLEYMQIYVKL